MKLERKSRQNKKTARKMPSTRLENSYDREIEIPVKIIRTSKIKRAAIAPAEPKFSGLANIAFISTAQDLICKSRSAWMKERKKTLLARLKMAFTAVLILGLAATQTFAVSGFEAHVINVTATISKKPCVEAKILSMGYWKNHSSVYLPLLPQFLGDYPADDQIQTATDVNNVFTANDSVMRNKLKKQLLAMKFNIAAFGIGGFLVHGVNETLDQIAADADNLLRANPAPADSVLETMKDLLDYLNNLEDINSCGIEPPPTPTPTPTPTPECPPCPPSNGCDNAVDITVNNTDEATIRNNTEVTANTGLNVSSGNGRGNASRVRTRNANADSEVVNAVNTDITDICNCQNRGDVQGNNHHGDKCEEENDGHDRDRHGPDERGGRNPRDDSRDSGENILDGLTAGPDASAGAPPALTPVSDPISTPAPTPQPDNTPLLAETPPPDPGLASMSDPSAVPTPAPSSNPSATPTPIPDPALTPDPISAPPPTPRPDDGLPSAETPDPSPDSSATPAPTLDANPSPNPDPGATTPIPAPDPNASLTPSSLPDPTPSPSPDSSATPAPSPS